MHDTAYRHGKLFFELYWDEAFHEVLDLGSQDVNGSLRDHCPPVARYTGLDMAPARGVDIVITPGRPLPIHSESIDVVVTSSCFEHDVCFWDTFVELVRVIRPGGLIYVDAPSNSFFHRYPLDCWRFYPDAGLALVEWARRCGIEIELIESFVAYPESEGWADFVAVFRKPDGRPLRRKGRIADHTRCMNIFGQGALAGADLELESNHTPDTIALSELRAKLEEISKDALDATYRSKQELDRLQGLLDHERACSMRQRDEIAEYLLALNDARLRAENLENSTIWRMTSPIRQLVSALRR